MQQKHLREGGREGWRKGERGHCQINYQPALQLVVEYNCSVWVYSMHRVWTLQGLVAEL